MGYFGEALERAKRRRSRWNLLLIPAVLGTWVLTWYASARALGQLVRYLHPDRQFAFLPDSGGGILMAIGLLGAWLPLAMVFGNLIVAGIPAARRVLDGEAEGVPETDFASSNWRLLKVAAFLTPAGLLIALVGVLVS